jgi:hypothetical protein
MASFEETGNALIAVFPPPGRRVPDGLPELARRKGVLPVTWDMGGVLAIHAAGDVVWWLWDEEHTIVVASAIQRHVA